MCVCIRKISLDSDNEQFQHNEENKQLYIASNH